MEALRLLQELEKLIENQKTFIGVTFDYHPDDLLALTNKIRAAMPELLRSEQVMGRTAIVLARHLRSPEEVAAVMGEIRAEAGA